MRGLRLALLASAGTISLSLALPAQASCSPDFGDKAMNWVNNEAGPQSRALAQADYTATCV